MRRFSYGWIVAVAGTFILMTSSNFQYTFGVFVRPMVDTFEWSRAAISGIASTRSIVFGILSPVSGALSDRYGPKRLVIGGVLISGLGYLISANVSSLWQAYLFLGAFAGLAAAAAYPAMMATVNRWFGGKSALANGIILCGFSLSQVTLPPLANWLMQDYGWTVSLSVIGVLVWVVGSIAWKFVKAPPAGVPDTGVTASSPKAPPTTAREYTLSQAARTRPFWILFIIYAIYAACYQMLVVHVVAAAIDAEITPAVSALILTFFGVSSTVARLTAWLIIPRLGHRLSLVIPLGLLAPLLLLLAFSNQAWMFAFIALVFGYVYGVVPPLIPMLTQEHFGARSLGATFGAMNGAYSAGMALGPWIGGIVFDLTGSYFIAFSLAAALMLGAFLLSLTLKRPAVTVN
jgi:MFS family permease